METNMPKIETTFEDFVRQANILRDRLTQLVSAFQHLALVPHARLRVFGRIQRGFRILTHLDWHNVDRLQRGLRLAERCASGIRPPRTCDLHGTPLDRSNRCPICDDTCRDCLGTGLVVRRNVVYKCLCRRNGEAAKKADRQGSP
jgi:hypothetical protein